MIIKEILQEVIEEISKEKATTPTQTDKEEEQQSITIEEDEVATTLQEMAQSTEHSPSSPPREQLELLSEMQVKEIAEEVAPIQQETQKIVLLSRLSRQDKKKEKMDESALLQHMLQEPAGTSTQAQEEEDKHQRPSLQESLQAAVAHLRNVQYHHMHDQEEL